MTDSVLPEILVRDDKPQPFELSKDRDSTTEPAVKPGTIFEVKEVELGFDTVYPCEELFASKYSKYAIVAGYKVRSFVGDSFHEDHEDKGPSQHESCPFAILINSALLVTFLAKTSGTKIRWAPCLLVYPFKLLVVYHKDIVTETLETKPELSSQSDVSVGAEDTPGSPEPLAGKPDTTKKESVGKPDEDQDALRRAVRFLIDFIEKSLKPLFDMQKKIIEGTLVGISFQDVWQLFSPGCTIIRGLDSKTRDRTAAFRVVAVQTGHTVISHMSRGFDTPSQPVRIYCYNLGYDGEVFRPANLIFEIGHYEGTKEIRELPVIPVNFAPDLDLAERGRRFLRDCYGHGQYKGLTESLIAGLGSEYIDTEVFVDFKAAYETAPPFRDFLDQIHPGTTPRLGYVGTPPPPPCHLGLACRTCVALFDDDDVDAREAEKFRSSHGSPALARESELLENGMETLLPPYLLAFGLASKKWYAIPVRRFSRKPPSPNKSTDDPFDSRHHKKILRAIIDFPRQFIWHDGERPLFKPGLVALLHGPPGSGKSSTLRAAAESTQSRRPLYHIGPADLSSKPEQFDVQLRAHISLASRWLCPILLKDAEIYLSERDDNLDRNRIVSAFLSILDQFRGAIFLSSDRVGLIDEALKSRIHIALHFTRPDDDTILKIWKDELSYLRDVTFGVTGDMVATAPMLRWAQHHTKQCLKQGTLWNRSMIRNALQVAAALAQEENWNYHHYASSSRERKNDAVGYDSMWITRISESHLERAAELTDSFNGYLEECRGKDEERVSEFSIRADNYESGKRRLRSPPRRGKSGTRIFIGFDNDSDEKPSKAETKSGEEPRDVIRSRKG
ncbi:hypothetical protein NKR23_g1047 [Pleurostoma richardsiae]|uniref:AAA+ ATPase domain-containing protein n=1 Tax=Pleurostoma richardsiae TaxID=41990 RepID=A0AA38RSD6_9PEZI|nr:hypothetical protein NKR23_g1047 [Pleurostoma richardsiae]